MKDFEQLPLLSSLLAYMYLSKTHSACLSMSVCPLTFGSGLPKHTINTQATLPAPTPSISGL